MKNKKILFVANVAKEHILKFHIKKEEGIKAPVFFKQKRVGKDQKLFNLYKFRTMKLSTPKDTPTHLLLNPEQYITSTGSRLSTKEQKICNENETLHFAVFFSCPFSGFVPIMATNMCNMS